MKVRLAEDMIKRQFAQKTFQVLKEKCELYWPELNRNNAQSIFKLFERWMQAYASEANVVSFRRLAEACAFHLMDPAGNVAPSLDYSSDLPAGFSPQQFLNIHEKLWSLQTRAAVAIKGAEPGLSLHEVHQKLEQYYEGHRVMAYQATMQTNDANLKTEIDLIMAKAYLTYAASLELEGFAHGGTSFVGEFRKKTAENLTKQEKAI